MKTSSNIRRGFMILAAIAVPALSWWGSWRYQAAKNAEAARIEAEQRQIAAKQQAEQWLQQQQMGDAFAEWKKSSEALSKRLAELEKASQLAKEGKLEQDLERLNELKQKYAEIVEQNKELRKIIEEKKAGRGKDIGILKSIEFGALDKRRTSWNGQTDPDSLWHDQRRDANRTLMEHGLPTLDGRGAFPDSAPMTRSFIPGVEPRK